MLVFKLLNRGVNLAEIFGLARLAKFLIRPGPALPAINLLYNFFEILQQNQYNYIKLQSHFQLV